MLHAFSGRPDGAFPYAGLLAGQHGEFFGTTVAGGVIGPSGYDAGVVYEISASGKEKVLYSFQGGNDGLSAQGTLIADSSGNLYGVTTYGGGSSNCSAGCGTVFQLRPSGSGYTERVLYAFQGGQDGELPVSALLLGSNGVLYGTTIAGGSGSGCWPPSSNTGCGTVYSLTPSGSTYTEKVLHSFTSGADGEYPTAKLTTDNKGNLYGTTLFGGISNTACQADPVGVKTCGTVFEVNAKDKERILYRFAGGASDGANTRAALLPGKNGSFYGVTHRGGGAGVGTAFQLTRNGKSYSEKLLYSFGSGGTGDGLVPNDTDGLITDKNGNLYGTTQLGGQTSCSCGTVFELSPAGSGYSETVLYSFGGLPDAEAPYSSVVLVGKHLYGTGNGGTLCEGSSFQCGAVYKVNL
ncbi:MAG: hypothetical protein JO060_02625 [Candidatus Eremiobacteraeota bacterium]|nr:hypothetical protein [Candidatus Eremiobacteraeota bacterium]